MNDNVLGEPPEPPAEVWERALAHAFDPANSFDPGLLPEPVEAGSGGDEQGEDEWGDDAEPAQDPADALPDDAFWDGGEDLLGDHDGHDQGGPVDHDGFDAPDLAP